MKSRFHILILLALSLGVYVATAAQPALLDDADASHALVSREMLQRSDWVVMYQDGIRYLEKAPLHYWMVAVSYKLFGQGAFQTRLPLVMGVVALVLMVYFFARRWFGETAAFYSGLVICTSVGTWLFTRVMVPEAIFALELTALFYLFLRAWNGTLSPRVGYWGASVVMALASLTLGLIGVLFPLGVVFFFILFTRSWGRWRELRIFSSSLIFLFIAVPWHLIAEHRSPGFLWSYFINEHFKRALGTRYPPDYEAVPLLLWWALHLVWFFPWSFFVGYAFREFPRFKTWGTKMEPAQQARLLLFIWAGLILFFFSLTSGSRMEYYSFGAWPAIAILLAVGLADAEEVRDRWLPRLQAGLAVIGLLATVVLGYLVLSSLDISSKGGISHLLQYHDLDTYRLSMAHIFDLTPQTFAALRGPAIFAMLLFIVGFGRAWSLRRRWKNSAATLTLALGMGLFFLCRQLGLQAIRAADVVSGAGRRYPSLPAPPGPDHPVRRFQLRLEHSVLYASPRVDLQRTLRHEPGNRIELSRRSPDVSGRQAVPCLLEQRKPRIHLCPGRIPQGRAVATAPRLHLPSG